jgi:hypothetical protein
LHKTCSGSTSLVFGLKEKAGRGNRGLVRGIKWLHVDKG